MYKFGISTACLYPEEVLNSVKTICNLKAEVIEIFYNSCYEQDNNTINLITKELKNSNTEILSFHPFSSIIEGLMFFSGYKNRVIDGLELYKRFFETAAKLGAKYFVFHGERNSPTFAQSQISEDCAFEVYYKLTKAAKESGILFTQENIAHFRSECPQFLSHLKKAIGKDIGFTFDIKQAFRAKEDPIEILEAMGENLVHFHINDFSFKNECTLPLKGDVNYTPIFEKLSQIDYTGDFVLEIYRSNFNTISDLSESLDKIKSSFPIIENFIVDRLEENYAILETKSLKYVPIKRIFLPANISDGDCIINKNGAFEIDINKTNVRKSIISKKLKSLFDN